MPFTANLIFSEKPPFPSTVLRHILDIGPDSMNDLGIFLNIPMFSINVVQLCVKRQLIPNDKWL